MKTINIRSFLRVCVRELSVFDTKKSKFPSFLRTSLYTHSHTYAHNHFDKSPYNLQEQNFAHWTSLTTSVHFSRAYGECHTGKSFSQFKLLLMVLLRFFLLLLEMQWNENYINSMRSTKWRSSKISWC